MSSNLLFTWVFMSAMLCWMVAMDAFASAMYLMSTSTLGAAGLGFDMMSSDCRRLSVQRMDGFFAEIEERPIKRVNSFQL